MATAAEAKRRRYELEVNARRRIPIGRQMLKLLVAIRRHSESSAIELGDKAGTSKRCTYVFLSRLKQLGLVQSRTVRDEYWPTGRRSEYWLTSSGDRLVDAWLGFLRTLGPVLVRKLRLEE